MMRTVLSFGWLVAALCAPLMVALLGCASMSPQGCCESRCVAPEYRLAPGDVVLIIGPAQKAGFWRTEFVVEKTGCLDLPYVRPIRVSGMTVHEVENTVLDAYVSGGIFTREGVSTLRLKFVKSGE